MDKAVGASIRIGFVFILIALSFSILKPFIAPLVWGVILAVGIYPLYKRLYEFLKGRKKLSATIIVIIGLAVTILPVIMFAKSTIDEVTEVVKNVEEGTLEIPQPNASVKDWPLIGSTIYGLWSQANRNLNTLFNKYQPQIKNLILKLSSVFMNGVSAVFLFIIALIISGLLLLRDEGGYTAVSRVFNLLAGEKGEELTNLSMYTIRSVVQGVIGIAVIQALFLSVGMFVIKIPAAGILSILVLIVAIMQLPLPLVMIPIVIYVFSYANTVPAIIFTVWTVGWCIADSFLKPILLGIGVGVPMLVILLGSMGGIMLGGLVGLFVGAVVLALTYKIFIALLEE